jgi:uncharacterized protein (DUF486 family)
VLHCAILPCRMPPFQAIVWVNHCQAGSQLVVLIILVHWRRAVATYTMVIPSHHQFMKTMCSVALAKTVLISLHMLHWGHR